MCCIGNMQILGNGAFWAWNTSKIETEWQRNHMFRHSSIQIHVILLYYQCATSPVNAMRTVAVLCYDDSANGMQVNPTQYCFRSEDVR